MIRYFSDNYMFLVLGAVFAFVATIILMKALAGKLPHDQGREFAVEGALSKGKVRGVGLVFIAVFIVADLIFDLIYIEKAIYLAVIAASMLTGFFDDASEKPWNEYLKGALDLILAIIVAVTYLHYNENIITLYLFGGAEIEIPTIVYGILIVVLVWTAINVTNCTDGVDGLSATLTIITLGSFYVFIRNYYVIDSDYTIFLFITVLVAYLWYNATPSSMLMGDAGSRAMGMMIAITALISGDPLLYIPFSLVMIADGGLGLLKVSVIRFLKIKGFLQKVRCPLHDHARKVKEWSNTQVVFRFAIIQLAINTVILAIMVWGF